MKKNVKTNNKKSKKNLIMGIAIIVVIVIIAIVINKTTSKNEGNENEIKDIQYTDQLNFTTYTDGEGNFITEYENGDKTIETRR